MADREQDSQPQGGPAKIAGELDRAQFENNRITQREIKDIEERSSPRTPVIYEIVRRLGEEEMARPATSLWWSGVAAGLSISLSPVAQAMLRARLPDASWRPLVASLGYSVGFLMVVMSRQQLFTENTVTVVLPVMADFSLRNLVRMGRLWAIVFCANFIGTLIAALFWYHTLALAPELKNELMELSRHVIDGGMVAMFSKGIAAGFLIAAMVWLLPSADAAQFHVITLMTYLIAAAGFAHIVAGSVEAFLLVIAAQISFAEMLGSFVVPVLIGNIVGGTALFALISYAQVMKEI